MEQDHKILVIDIVSWFRFKIAGKTPFFSVTKTNVQRIGSLILTVVYWCYKNRDNNKLSNILALGVAELSWAFVKNTSHPKFVPIQSLLPIS